MADSKVTGLTELVTPPADDDMIYLADVSDTTMASSGTSKKNKAKHYIRSNGTANTLGAGIDANGYNFTGAGTVAATGRVGIGTAAPSYPLHISAASGVQAFINATSGQYTQLSLSNAGVEKGAFGFDNSGGYGYIHADGAIIYFDGGNVGVDKIPTAKLDVNGSFQCTSIGGDWTNVSFNAGWGNYGAPWQTAQYKKAGDLVFLRGLVVRSSGSSSTVFTLPAGYRPPSYVTAPTVSNDLFGYITIDTSGNVILSIGSPTAWVSLNGIWFSTV